MQKRELQMKVFPDHPLARKIAIVTAIKLAGLLFIWWAFFSGHGAGGMSPDQVGNAILHPSTHNATRQ